jgi:hypothetical protein
MAPFVEVSLFMPYRVDCGPRSTSTRSMSNSGRAPMVKKSAKGTPSTMTVTVGSTSALMFVRPRMPK